MLSSLPTSSKIPNKPLFRSLSSRDSPALVVDIPATIELRKPGRRWRYAFAVIYSTRALLSLAKGIVVHASHTIVNVNPSIEYRTLSNQNDHHYHVEPTSLVKMVKEKSFDLLRQLGGVQAIVTNLGSHVDNGIHGDDEDVRRRREAFGSNTYHRPPPKGFLHFLLEAFKDSTIIILLVCATLSLAFGIKENGIKEGWYDGSSITFAVFLVVTVSAVTNFRQSRQFHELSKVSNNIQVEVTRKGRPQKISIFDILVGDVVNLKIGDQIPADGLFLNGHSLQVDESSMTGESNHVEIDENVNPFLFSGAKIANGHARMVVTAVGMNTLWGEMMSSISQDSKEQTPLQTRLSKLTSSIGKVGLVVAFLVLLVLLTRYFTGNTKDENGYQEFNGRRTQFDDVMNAMVRIIAAAVTIIVVAIPEGLPLAVTLTLAYSMKRMMADQAMVRKLSACETMGSATIICTDKTGTLTMNKMMVTKFVLGKDHITGNFRDIVSLNVLELLHQGVSQNTTAILYKATKGSEPEYSGSPTEKAILSWAVQELDMNVKELKQNYVISHVETFNSQKKRSGVLIKCKIDNTFHVHWKGAAEMILAMCSSYYDKSGIIKPMDDGQRDEIKRIIEGLAAETLRCIAFAHKQIIEPVSHCIDDGKMQLKLDEDGLIFLGIVGLKDPCRPGVRQAMQVCKKAGVKIKMITGDNIFTARAIAIECGILGSNQSINDSEVIVEGETFRNYTPEERMDRVEKIRILARSSPLDKLLMVRCLKQKGHVVAVTGDGTNDAPALKEADVGLSMGIQGTEVAKECSDIVILDDNFTTLVTVLKWGRCVYNNIQKFIQFQLTVNVAALVINFVAACSAGEVPLTTVQLLWVNLIMDTLGALALATERPSDELMEKKPVGRVEPLVTNVMWRNLISQALYQILILLILQFKGQSIFNMSLKIKNTLIFNTFVLCQVFNEFNARKMEKKNVFKGLRKNRLFLWIVVVTVVLQVIMVEFLHKFANTKRLDWLQWGLCIVLAAMSWPLAWVVKCIPVPEKPFLTYVTWKRLRGPI
ncbi:calcium-transporting ATPase 12, plasma membrane-type-like [Cornus florida]|uniref:calcium-transporting ATPase 12, plasma membrane-type-like n=1 Tax=Cornus florida TaxID=4283 RepID=UPI00289CE22C|nr:calcium-transporting ATPase 12, plasma membrane-type-like [Cornus florida]